MRIRLFVLACMIGAAAFFAFPKHAAQTKPVTAAAIPMWFERNTGSLPAQVLYASRSFNQTVFLTADSMVVSTPSGSSVKIGWRGGSPAKATRGEQPLQARVDYFRGADRGKWQAGEANRYGKVRYEQVYPGVDLVFHPMGEQLEHDFVVAPGADPKQIALTFSGASGMRMEADGSLVLTAGKDEVRQSKPVAYQMIDGQRVEVAANFVVSGEAEARFELGSYDASRELVIDPVLRYSSYLGGTAQTVPAAMATDAATGVVWITGTTNSTDFPQTGDLIRDTGFGNRDIFIAQIDPSKSGADSLLYGAFVGGTGNDEPAGMAIGPDGNAVIVGTTTSGDFPIVGSYDSVIESGRDAFAIKIDPRRAAKDALVYTTLIGGDGEDFATAVTTDSLGRIIMAGHTVSENFPLTANAIQRNRQRGYELFVAKIDPDAGANGLNYSTYYGGSGTDFAYAVAVNPAGLIYVAGHTTSDNFPIGNNAYQPVYQGGGDMFVIRIDTNKSGIDGIDYGTYVGGSGIDQANAMYLDAAGNVYLAGYTTSVDLPIAGSAPQTRNAGLADVYVAKLSIPSSQLQFATYLGGSRTDIAYGMNVDSAGRIHLTGYTYSTDFRITNNALQRTNAGASDAFAVTLNPALTAAESLVYSSYWGSAGFDVGYAASADNNCTVSVSGSTTGKQFKLTDSAYQQAPAGFPDAFVSSVNICQ